MHPLPYWRLSGYYFFYFAFIGAFSPYFGLYLQSLAFSAWEIGLLMSQMQLMRLVGPNLWGWLTDRFGWRLAIVRLAGGIGLAGFTAFFWLDRLPGMLLAMAVLAFFWSAALPLVETLTFDHLREERGRYSRIRLWGSIGFIVAVMATGALIDATSPLSVLWMCWSILLGILLNAMVLTEATPLAHDRAEMPIGNILRQGKVKALMAACFAMSAAHGAFYVFYSIHLDAHGYSKTEIGLLWSLGVVAEIVVFMLMASLARRFSLRDILLASFVAAVVRFVLMGWGVESAMLMIFVQLLHGLTFGAYHASAIAAVNQWFPGKTQGRGQALYSSLSFGAGGLLGALISGRTWDWLGSGWTFTLSAAFALVGVLLIWHWVPSEAPGPVSGRQKIGDPVQ
ncbi:MAG: MFS transporter [Dechloromonas agitata]|uniref:MFS transporter n=1 Tax=Dechloromonas agitata TaxID=73030 RepID=A0A930FYG1_9RHOO|nr:MFS transporter [Dechloromonas agitata]